MNAYDLHVIKQFRNRAYAHALGAVLGLAIHPLSEMVGSLLAFVSIGALVPTLKQLKAVQRNRKEAKVTETAEGQITILTKDGISVRIPEDHACLKKIGATAESQNVQYLVRIGIIHVNE